MNNSAPILRCRATPWNSAVLACAATLHAAEPRSNFRFVYNDGQRWEAMGVFQHEQGVAARFSTFNWPVIDRMDRHTREQNSPRPSFDYSTSFIGTGPTCFAVLMRTHNLVKYPHRPDWTEVLELTVAPEEYKNPATELALNEQMEAAEFTEIPGIDARSYLSALMGETIPGGNRIETFYCAAFGHHWLPLRGELLALARRTDDHFAETFAAREDKTLGPAVLANLQPKYNKMLKPKQAAER